MHILMVTLILWLGNITSAYAELYQWTDTDGVIHVVDETVTIPEAYRKEIKVYRGADPAITSIPTAAPLSPSREYAENSQGAFAQRLALDLGLIQQDSEDAIGPLIGVGIRPSGSWRVYEPLTPEVAYDVLAATRRAADSKRLTLSANGAEAIAQQAAERFLPAPDEEEPLADQYGYDQPTIIIEQAPAQITEVIYEPYYVPVPVVVGTGSFDHHHDGRRGRRDDAWLAPPPDQPEHIRRGPTHLPFGSIQQPFGSSHPMNRTSLRGRGPTHLPRGSSHPLRARPSLRR
jgi:hypothetical protein